MKNPRKRLGIVVLAAGLLVGGIWLWGVISARRDQQAAEWGVQQSVRAVLVGDYAVMERYQLGDELDRLGLERPALERYRKALLDGYLSPDASLRVTRKALTLPPAKNDYERNMQQKILQRQTTNPVFTVEIGRSDGKPPVSFSVNALRGADGWVISPASTLAYLQVKYADDPKTSMKHVVQAMEKASIEAICSPSGTWLRKARVQEFLNDKIAYADIYQP